MNNEPVAWMIKNRDSGKVCGAQINKPSRMDKTISECIPLYTHLAKTQLSRMEVYELAIDSGFMLSTQYGQAENKLMPVSDGDTLVKLANAILRKANEK